MARGMKWPLAIGPGGGFALTDSDRPDETTTQELGIGLTSEMSAQPYHRIDGTDSPSVAYAAARDGGRGVALRRAATVFAAMERLHRAHMLGTPEIVRSGSGWRVSIRYRSIETGGDVRTIQA